MQDQIQNIQSVFSVQRTLGRLRRLIQVGNNTIFIKEMIQSPINNSFISSMLEISMSSHIQIEYRQLSLIVIEKIIKNYYMNEEKVECRGEERKNDYFIVSKIRNQILAIAILSEETRLLRLLSGIVVLFATNQESRMNEFLAPLDQMQLEDKWKHNLYICVYGDLVDYYYERISQFSNLATLYNKILRNILKVMALKMKKEEQLYVIEQGMKIIGKGMNRKILSQVSECAEDIFQTAVESIGFVISIRDQNSELKRRESSNKVLSYSFGIIDKLYEWAKFQDSCCVETKFKRLKQLTLSLTSKLLTDSKGLQRLVFDQICKCLCSIAEYDQQSYNLINSNSITILSLLLSSYYIKAHNKFEAFIYDKILIEQLKFEREGLIRLFSVLFKGGTAEQIKIQIIKALTESYKQTNFQNAELSMYIMGQFPQYFHFGVYPQLKGIVIMILKLKVQGQSNQHILLKLRALKILFSSHFHLHPIQISQVFNFFSMEIQYSLQILNLRKEEHATILLLIISYIQFCVSLLQNSPNLVQQFNSKRIILRSILSLIQLNLAFDENVSTEPGGRQNTRIPIEENQIFQLLLKLLEKMTDQEISYMLEQTMEAIFGVYHNSILELKQNLECKFDDNLHSVENFDQKNLSQAKTYQLCIRSLDFLIRKIKQKVNQKEITALMWEKYIDVIWNFVARFASKQVQELVTITEDPIEGYLYIINEVLVALTKLSLCFDIFPIFSHKITFIYVQLIQKVNICMKILSQTIKFYSTQAPTQKQIIDFQMDQQFVFDGCAEAMRDQKLESNLVLREEKRQIYLFINGSKTIRITALSLIHSILSILHFELSQKGLKQVLGLWELFFKDEDQLYQHYCFRQRKIILSVIRVMLWNRMINPSNLKIYLHLKTKELESARNRCLQSKRVIKFVIHYSIIMAQLHLKGQKVDGCQKLKQIIMMLGQIIQYASLEQIGEQDNSQIISLEQLYSLQSMKKKQKSAKGLEKFSATIVEPEELASSKVFEQNVPLLASQWIEHQKNKLRRLTDILSNSLH